MTTFQDRTIADLQDKIRALREVLSSHEAEASHHRERHNYYQGLASRSRADLDDYECLLGYAEAVNAKETKAEAAEVFERHQANIAHDTERYTEAQLDGQACAECGVDFAEYAPTVPTGLVIDGGQLFAHIACAESEA